MSRASLFMLVAPLALAACASTDAPAPADPTAPSLGAPVLSADAVLTELDRDGMLDLSALGDVEIGPTEPDQALSDADTDLLFEAETGRTRLDLLTGPAAFEDLSPADWGRDGVTPYDDELAAPPYGSYTRWVSFPVQYCIADSTPDVGLFGTLTAIGTAAQTISAASRAKLVLTSDCAEADIVIDFDSTTEADYSPFDGVNGVLAHAYYPYTGGQMEFDEAETWTTAVQATNAQPIDLQTVALHEFGHAMGLTHSSVSGAVMGAFYGGSLRTLTADDISGLQYMYGAPLATCESAWTNAGNAENYAYLAWVYAYNAMVARPDDIYASYANTYAYYAWWYANAADEAMQDAVEGVDTWSAYTAWSYAIEADKWAYMSAYQSVWSEWAYGNTASVTPRTYDGYTMYYADLVQTQAYDCFAGR